MPRPLQSVTKNNRHGGWNGDANPNWSQHTSMSIRRGQGVSGGSRVNSINKMHIFYKPASLFSEKTAQISGKHVTSFPKDYTFIESWLRVPIRSRNGAGPETRATNCIVGIVVSHKCSNCSEPVSHPETFPRINDWRRAFPGLQFTCSWHIVTSKFGWEEV